MFEPLDVLIIERTQRLLTKRGLGSQETFAQDVRAFYEQLVPEHQRTIKWSDSKETSTRFDNDKKHVMRYVGRNPKLPAELVGGWLMALPETDRQQILSAFLEQFNLLLVDTPNRDASVTGHTLSLADLMRECAEAVEAIAPMLDNNVIGPEDRHLAKNALMQLAQLVKVATDYQIRIASILPGEK